jgi:hypothetical protein
MVGIDPFLGYAPTRNGPKLMTFRLDPRSYLKRGVRSITNCSTNGFEFVTKSIESLGVTANPTFSCPPE